MNLFISKAIEYQIKNKFILEHEKEIYEYAYIILIEECINVMVAFIIGLLLGELKIVGSFLCSYIPLRRFSGGYHANNGLVCGIVSSILIILLCVLNNSSINIIIQNSRYIFVVIAQICICILTPVDSKNKRLSDYEKKKYHKTSIIILLIQITIIFFSFLLEIENLYWGIIYSHMVLCFMMIIGTCKNRAFKQEEN